MPRIQARSRLISMIDNGELPVGAFVMSTDAATTAIFGNVGYDFVIIDREHGPNDVTSTLNHIRAAEANGVIPIVRVLENSATLIQSTLDIGAHGIVVPKIATADDARRAVLASRYVAGGRGMCQATEAARWAHDGWHAHKASSNENVLIIPLVETAEGIENLDEIAAVDGIDFIFFGLADLSQDLGIDMYADADQLIRIWDESVVRARRADVHLGSPLGYGFDHGDYGTVDGDLMMLRAGAESALAPLRKIAPGSAANRSDPLLTAQR
ncbi:HpcH/HpaI aldolase/citrate lyase family protein [Rhodococcus sp. KRD162]|uniref:HpcH/HpaI aldolase family protein n=2 Tax=Rhodococcus TaxID=1827 RepID=UPI0019D20A6E|nr:aldolase/citrate lyase family protein [Rhodococcus sp. KRD162]